MIQDSGGTTLTDKFLPARATIVRVFTAKWPNCAKTATANGFPKLVKRKGAWEFDTEWHALRGGEAGDEGGH